MGRFQDRDVWLAHIHMENNLHALTSEVAREPSAAGGIH